MNNTAVVWVCSPNNPTGVHIAKDKMTSFLNNVPKETLVVIDDAYHDYVVADDFYNSIEFANNISQFNCAENFFENLRTRSLRIGYGVANQDLIRVLEPIREPLT